MEHDLSSEQEPMSQEPAVQEPVVAGPEPVAVPEPAKEAKPACSKNIRGFIFGVVVTIIVAVVVFGTAVVYRQALTDAWVARAASVIPFPAAFVSGRPVWLSDFLFEYKGMQKYQSQASALTDEYNAAIRKQVLSGLERRTIVNRLALDQGVYLTKEVVDATQAELVPAGATPDQLAQDVDRLFGWDMEGFRAHLVRPVALEKMLNERVIADARLQAGPRKEINAALIRLQKGEAFADVAKTVNEQGMLPEDGAIGKVSLDSLPSTVAEAIKGLKDGEVTPVVEIAAQNDWAFYLIRLNGREEKDAQAVVDLSVIRVKKTTLDDVVSKALERARIWRIVS